MVRSKQPHQVSDGARIRRLAALENVEVVFTCDEKLRKNEIWRQDARSALKTATVVRSERRGGEWRRTIRGCDLDEGEIFLVVTVDQDTRRIVILDGWRQKR